MIKKLQKIGNSRGIVLDKALLELLNIEEANEVELVPRDEGILLKKVDVRSAYETIGQRHRASLDKLAE